MRLHDISKGSEGEKNVLSDEKLKALQNVLLMILDDMSEICHKNKISFVLIGGTAIGALRHKGFIPWDDDVDIAMTRKDYEKFARIIRSEYSHKYGIYDAKDTNNYGKIIPKLRLRGTTYRTILEKDIDDCGIRIDIFLIENVHNSGIMRYWQGVRSMFYGFALACRRMYDGRKQYLQMTDSISAKIKTAIGFLFSFASLEKWAKWTDKVYSSCKDSHSKWVSVPTDGGHFFGELTKRENLCKHAKVSFEGRTFNVPVDYEAYLTRIYGNYMKVPPVDKRVRSTYLDYDLGIYK